MSSFLSEKTVEFMLIPERKSILSSVCSSLVPITFWKSREGSGISCAVRENEQIRLLALFTRRPKLKKIDEKLTEKINHELYKFGNEAAALGIPAIAGFTVVRTIFSLYETPTSHWFSSASAVSCDVEFAISAKEHEMGKVLATPWHAFFLLGPPVS